MGRDITCLEASYFLNTMDNYSRDKEFAKIAKKIRSAAIAGSKPNVVEEF